MTTDTRVKMASAAFVTDGGEVRIWGAAKGAGMIHPRLGAPVGASAAAPHATMLVYLFTDIIAEAEELRAALPLAVEPSFNSISIDGDTSTNDTVLLLASGASGVRLTRELLPAFDAALGEVCRSLAHQIVDDGEGVGHVVTLDVRGAATWPRRSWWRRPSRIVLCARRPGRAAIPTGGVCLRRRATAVRTSSRSGCDLDRCRAGVRVRRARASFDEATAHAAMMPREYTITIDLGEGDGACKFLTCDLTAEYVSINADYST